ncbi:guanine nucleotide-exchange factor SEC12-like isoform X2 [Antedon mediterranea]|uniref:guanine nucleotide-exchange factor SEC12-like isoform X2 n=1 Tax=Antedon mediterranea TaxID=105859 RepID=UPI003AF5CBB5
MRCGLLSPEVVDKQGQEFQTELVDNEHGYVMACGMDEKCQLFTLKKVTKLQKDVSNEVLEKKGGRRRKRGGNTKEETNVNTEKRQDTKKTDNNQDIEEEKLTYEMNRFTSVVSVNGEGDQYQKSVCFDPHGMFIYTAGTDGKIRKWTYPNMVLETTIDAHENEIDEIMLSPFGNRLISISKDCTAKVWKPKSGELFGELFWDVKVSEKTYRFRSCRFGLVAGKTTECSMFTLHIPHIQSRKSQPSYITKWDTTKFIPQLSVSTGQDILSCIAVSHGGHYVGVGTMTGSIAVYVAFSLKKLHAVNSVHSIFVTGLSFVPITKRTRKILGELDAALLSVSPDKSMKITPVFSPIEYPVWLMFIGAAVIIVCIFFFLAYMGFNI